MTFSKCRIFRFFPILLLTTLGLAGCYYIEPYPGPLPPPGTLPERPGWSPAQISAFEDGQDLGRADARRGLRPGFERYIGEFPPVLRPYAREGYRVGYEEGDFGRPGPGLRERYYDDGYDLGRRDYRRGLRPRPERYAGEYPRRWEYYFETGYRDGYNGEPYRVPREL